MKTAQKLAFKVCSVILLLALTFNLAGPGQFLPQNAQAASDGVEPETCECSFTGIDQPGHSTEFYE